MHKIKNISNYFSLWLILIISAVNLLYMHYYILHTASMDDESNFTRFLDNILGIAIDISVVFIIFYFITAKNQKFAAYITLIVTTLWSFSNILYSRFFHHYISLSAIYQSGSLFDDFMFKCVAEGIRWTDIYFLFILLFFLPLINLKWQKAKRPIVIIIGILCICAIVNFIGYLTYCCLSPERRYVQFLVDRIEARHFSNSIQLCNPNVATFRRGCIRALAYELALNLQGPIHLTKEQRAEIDNFINTSKQTSHFYGQVSPRNVIFIIIESYMSFVSDMKVNGKEVTPFLNNLKRDSSTFYNGQMQRNVTIGESSDGQFIYMTGLLPLRSYVTISQARKNDLPPTLPMLLGRKSRMIIPTVETMWRQDEMCRQYGFDSLYTSKDYNKGYYSILTDEQVFRLAMKLDKHSQEPFFSVILTMSMHQPYSEQIDSTFYIKDSSIRADLASYLNKCHYTDKQLEKYFSHLKQTGLYNNSLIVLASDHPVLSTNFGGVSNFCPLYIINQDGWPSYMWKGKCNQVDVFSTLVDLLCEESPWHGLGHSLVSSDYDMKLSNHSWDISEWIILGDYFKKQK